MESEIMTMKEVAEHLKINEKTIYRLASEGEILGSRSGIVGDFVSRILMIG